MQSAEASAQKNMRAVIILFFIFLVAMAVSAQDVITGAEPGSNPILFNGDAVVLESGEPRKDLNCTVTPQKTLLGFDLKFHAGYAVAVPLQDLQGDGNNLTILFRVTPKGQKGDSVYFNQQVRVPPLTDKSSGTVGLEGNFDVGEGAYHVDWLMRDFGGRFCSSYWDFDVALPAKDRRMAVALPSNAIRRTEEEQFQNEPPVRRSSDEAPIDVKVLMNFAPQRQNAAAVDPLDTLALVSIVRSIARNPKIGKFSLVAFNIQEQRELYRQEFADHIDFPALGAALKQIKPGTVDLNRLSRKHGDTEFLSTLVKQEIGKQEIGVTDARPDALIFVGPKALLDSSVSEDELKSVGDVEFPVFYMNFNSDPMGVPWKDTIGKVVKFFKGREYTIAGPRDLWNAVTEIVSRVSKTKPARPAGPVTTGEM